MYEWNGVSGLIERFNASKTWLSRACYDVMLDTLIPDTPS
jgi:hypothetical protein